MAKELVLGTRSSTSNPSNPDTEIQMSNPSTNNSNDEHKTLQPSNSTGNVLAYSPPPSIPSSEASEPPSPTKGPIRNFGEISPGIYRSSFPGSCNIEHLQSLNLKTVITLVNTPFDPELERWIASSGIEHYRINIVPHKRQEDNIPMQDIASVMKLLTDETKQPLLMHCNKGRHRTGCISAAFCKISGMIEEKVLADYQEYAQPKPRELDMVFIRGLRNGDVRDAMARLEGGSVLQCIQYGQRDGLVTVGQINNLAKDSLTQSDGFSGRGGHGLIGQDNPKAVNIRRVVLGPEMPLSPPPSIPCKACGFSVQDLFEALSRIGEGRGGRDIPTPPATPSPSE